MLLLLKVYWLAVKQKLFLRQHSLLTARPRQWMIALREQKSQQSHDLLLLNYWYHFYFHQKLSFHYFWYGILTRVSPGFLLPV